MNHPQPQSQPERRFTSSAQAPVRIETRDDGRQILHGHGAVFYRADDPGTEFLLHRGSTFSIVERIMPGAFDRALREAHDVRGLFNHNPSLLLGRSKAGTLRLSVDAAGLKYEIDPPDTQAGHDTLTSIQRGDLSGSSFSFRASRVVWIEEEDRDIRQIEDVDLFDVGPVTFPAYQSADAGLSSRAMGDLSAAGLVEQRQALRESREAEAVAVRLRLLDLDAA